MRVQHLILRHQHKFLGAKWVTIFHEDLGDDLQAALDVLTDEGWEAVGTVPLGGFDSGTGLAAMAILLKRPREKGE